MSREAGSHACNEQHESHHFEKGRQPLLPGEAIGQSEQRFEDDHLHAAILANGDHEAAKKVSDQVARDVGLTEAEIEALSAPPPTRGKGK